jgi:SNF2-related domain
MILQGLEAARKEKALPRTSGASLVTVPSVLVNQWKDEVDKFTTGLHVLCIHDTDCLRKTTVKSIVEGDVVIFPIDILESKGYTENLSAKSGLESVQIPELQKSGGHVEKLGTKGIWIPKSSRDPYGLGVKNEMKASHTFSPSVKTLKVHAS